MWIMCLPETCQNRHRHGFWILMPTVSHSPAHLSEKFDALSEKAISSCPAQRVGWEHNTPPWRCPDPKGSACQSCILILTFGSPYIWSCIPFHLYVYLNLHAPSCSCHNTFYTLTGCLAPCPLFAEGKSRKVTTYFFIKKYPTEASSRKIASINSGKVWLKNSAHSSQRRVRSKSIHNAFLKGPFVQDVFQW